MSAETETTSKGPAVSNPFFARVWPAMVNREPASMTALRREMLSGLSGTVLEVGAGSGTNFALYPDSVERVIAFEPEAQLRELATKAAEKVSSGSPLFEVRDGTFEALPLEAGETVDAVVCSLVLCTVVDPEGAMREALRVLKPGGELRFMEHVAGEGAIGAVQRVSDATFWPRMFGGCHTHRDSERVIADAGFEIKESRTELQFPKLLPIPVSPIASGTAIKPL